MPHDLAHEHKQNEAIRAVARAVQGLAAEVGKSSFKALLDHVDEILNADDKALDEPDAPAGDPAVTVDVEEVAPPAGESK